MLDCLPNTQALPVRVQHVHLWFASVPKAEEAGLFSRYLALMSQQECERYARFVFQRDKRRYAVTRALVRSVLSRYADISPECWVFEEGTYGRPEIASENQQARSVRFNIAHTSELVVLAVTRHREVGVDVESIVRPAPLEIADNYFSACEIAALRAMPPDEQALRFWELWTLKESYIKARGIGLSLPLNKFAFRMVHPDTVVFTCDHGLDASPTRWMFCQLNVDEDHLVSLCVERATTEHIELVCHCIVPLAVEWRWCGPLTRFPADVGACSMRFTKTMD